MVNYASKIANNWLFELNVNYEKPNRVLTKQL